MVIRILNYVISPLTTVSRVRGPLLVDPETPKPLNEGTYALNHIWVPLRV